MSYHILNNQYISEMGSCGSEVGEVTTPTLRDQGKKVGRVNQGENPKYEQKIEEEMQGNITS